MSDIYASPCPPLSVPLPLLLITVQSAGGGAYNPALAGGAVGAQAYPYQLDPMQQQQAYGGRPPAAAQQRGGYAGGAPIGQSPVHVAAVAQQVRK